MKYKEDPNFSFRVYSTQKELAHAVVERIAVTVKECSAKGRPAALGLAAGNSPLDVYLLLSRLVANFEIDLSQVTAFCLDEYYPIHSSDPRSFANQLTTVAVQLGIPLEKLKTLRGNVPPEEIGHHCNQYETEIQLAGGIDFQLLGVGGSGHIGFNEPGSDPNSRTRLVELCRRTRTDAAPEFAALDNVPQQGITMGIATILAAREIALIACGAHKAGIVRHLLEEPITSALPASFIRAHQCATVYLDKEAAQFLSRR